MPLLYCSKVTGTSGLIWVQLCKQPQILTAGGPAPAADTSPASLVSLQCIRQVGAAGENWASKPGEPKCQTAASHLRTLYEVFSKESIQIRAVPQTKQCLHCNCDPSGELSSCYYSNWSHGGGMKSDVKKHCCGQSCSTGSPLVPSSITTAAFPLTGCLKSWSCRRDIRVRQQKHMEMGSDPSLAPLGHPCLGWCHLCLGLKPHL